MPGNMLIAPSPHDIWDILVNAALCQQEDSYNTLTAIVIISLSSGSVPTNWHARELMLLGLSSRQVTYCEIK